MPILNYTTKVGAAVTVGRVQALLAKRGASDVMVSYMNGHPVALSFALPLEGSGAPLSFRLPANWEGVLSALTEDPAVPRRYCESDHALRVSWRILKDWLEAQLALIDAGMATLPQVMLPYAITPTGATLYERILDEGPQVLALGAGDA